MGNLVRTLRSALDGKIDQKLVLGSSIVPRMTLHAGYFVIRCRVQSHGTTSLQLMEGRSSLTELIPFGEHVL